ncbi:MAG: hypothetical protein ABIP93_08910 [Gemmatimonadaceae bacterium]
MTNSSDKEASTPNAALAPLARLVGTWTTLGSHALIPDTVLRGKTTFDWLEAGAFLRSRSEIDHPEIPTGVTIIGSDDALGTLSMLYFDERGVSRRYEVSMQGDVFRWWRDAAGFSQRYACTLTDDDRTMIGKGELSKDGSSWERDLDLTYTRVR